MNKKYVQMKIPAAIKIVITDTQKIAETSQQKVNVDFMRIVSTNTRQKPTQAHMPKKSLRKKIKK